MSIHRQLSADNQLRHAVAAVVTAAREERERSGADGELKILEHGLSELGPSWRLLAAHGDALDRLGLHEQARWSFDRAARRGDRSGNSHYRSGLILLQQRRFARADNRFAEAAALGGEVAAASYGRGLAALGMDQHAAALTFFDEATGREPSWDEPRLWAAQTLQQAGRAHDALERYYGLLDRLSQQNRSDSFFARVSHGLAESLAVLGRHSDALEVAERGLKSLSATADSDGLRVRLIGTAFDAAFRSKQFSRMLDYGPALLRRASGPLDAMVVRSAYVAAAAQQGDFPGTWRNLAAIGRLYERSADDLKRLPLTADQWLGFVSMLLLLEKYDHAEELLRMALMKTGDVNSRVGVYLQMVSFYFEQRDEADEKDWLNLHRRGMEAARIAERLLLAELERDQSPRALFDLGSLYLVLEDYGAAQTYLRQAVDAAPALVETRARLGIACAAQGDGKEALRLLRSCLADNPMEFELRIPLAWAYRLEGALDRAEEELRVTTRMAPAYLPAELALAEVLISRGDEGDADAFLEAERMLARTIERSRDTAARAPRDRLTSGRLGSRREAQALYARGYALVRTVETGGIKQARKGGIAATLRTAEQLFAESAEKDVSSPRAARARDAVREYRKTSAASGRVERVAVPLLLVAEVALLALVQAGFIGWWRQVRLEPGYYVLATFGLLLMVIATLYLPNLLRLKVVGVELEKAAEDPAGPRPTLNLQNAPTLDISKHISRLPLPEEAIVSPPRHPGPVGQEKATPAEGARIVQGTDNSRV